MRGPILSLRCRAATDGGLVLGQATANQNSTLARLPVSTQNWQLYVPLMRRA